MEHINVAYKIPDHVQSSITNALKDVPKENQVYSVSKPSIIPHVTIYQGLYPSESIDELIDWIIDLTQEHPTFSLYFLRIVQEGSSLWAQFANNIHTLTTHLMVATQFLLKNDFAVEPTFLPESEVYQNLPPHRQEQIDTYGNPYAGAMYDPHCSLVKYTSPEDAQKASPYIDWDVYTIPISEIALYRSGEHGTCIEEITSCKLQDNA